MKEHEKVKVSGHFVVVHRRLLTEPVNKLEDRINQPPFPHNERCTCLDPHGPRCPCEECREEDYDGAQVRWYQDCAANSELVREFSGLKPETGEVIIQDVDAGVTLYRGPERRKQSVRLGHTHLCGAMGQECRVFGCECL